MLALLYYDFVITFPDEVKCIWQRKFSGATILFCINRYGTLLAQTLVIVEDLYAWQTQTEETADMVGFFPALFSL